MRYAVKIGILAGTLGIAAAGGVPAEERSPAANFQERPEPKLPPQEPSKDPTKDQKIPGKGVNPAERQALPEESQPGETPASTEEILDCEYCLIAQHDVEESLPMAVAKTLWGFFFVGRPRLNVKPSAGTVLPKLPLG